MTIRAAQNLQKCGFKKGDVVAVLAPDVPTLAPIAFGAICMGLPIMNIPGPFKSIFNKIEPKLVFCVCEDYDEIDEVLRELQLNPKIYTFNGIKGRSEAAETFVGETGIENDFS